MVCVIQMYITKCNVIATYVRKYTIFSKTFKMFKVCTVCNPVADI